MIQSHFKAIIKLFFLVAMVCASNAQTVAADIKLDELRSGTLDNGMQYFIKHNQEPKERASFYFAQNVGSILEDDAQQGLAHFLEHMAFNGTQNFPDKKLLEYLEKNGIVFGADVNAFTSFDETVYNINNVPTGREALLDSVLLVLHDWSGGIALLDKEIDKERGVILEEWRSSNTANQRRLVESIKKGYAKDSKYANRLPIGLMEIVTTFEYEALRDYYKKWYRPDLQAVIIVGDIDVVEMEKKVKDLFSKIPLRPNLPKREAFTVPINDEILFVPFQDDELDFPSLDIGFKHPIKKLAPQEVIKEMLLKQLSSGCFNSRMAELLLDINMPAEYITLANEDFVRPLSVTSFGVTPKKGKTLAAFEYGYRELLRYKKHGPLQSELDRAKTELKEYIEDMLRNLDQQDNDSYAALIYDSFFKGQPQTDLAWSLTYSKELLAAISLEEVKAFTASKLREKGRVINASSGTQYQLPTKEECLAIMAKVESETLTPHSEVLLNKELFPEKLKPKKVVSKKTKVFNGKVANYYTLRNGITFVTYHHDEFKDQLSFRAFKSGGMSLVKQEDLPSAEIATDLASRSGLSDFTAIELSKHLVGTQSFVSTSISEYEDMLMGSGAADELELLMQLIHLTLTKPSFDDNQFQLLAERYRSDLETKNNNPKAPYSDSYRKALANNHPRLQLFNTDYIQKLSLEKAKAVYQERFKNTGDFTYVFVGDFDEDTLVKYARQYLGNLPKQSGKEAFINHKMYAAKGKTIVRDTVKMVTPQTTVQMLLEGNLAYTKTNMLLLNTYAQLLEKRLMERVREDEGGTYGVSLIPTLNKHIGSYTLELGFDCNPDIAEKLVGIVHQEWETLNEKVNADDLAEIKKGLLNNFERSFEGAGYWEDVILNNLKFNAEVIDHTNYKEYVNSVTANDIMAFGKKALTEGNLVEGVLSPLTK